MKTCELCKGKTNELEKSLIMVRSGKLEDYHLCRECVEGINNAEDEVKFVESRREQANATT